MAEDSKDDKHAKTPPKSAKKSRDDEDAESQGTPSSVMLKQKTLATALSRAIVISTAAGSLAYIASTLFSARYELVPAPNPSNNFVYRLDRLTGGVQFCGQQQCIDVVHTETVARSEK